jgi:hypothetical protein
MAQDEVQGHVGAQAERLDEGPPSRVLPTVDASIAGAEHRLVDDARLKDRQSERQQDHRGPAPARPPHDFADQEGRCAVERAEEQDREQQRADVSGAVVVGRQQLGADRAQDEKAEHLRRGSDAIGLHCAASRPGYRCFRTRESPDRADRRNQQAGRLQPASRGDGRTLAAEQLGQLPAEKEPLRDEPVGEENDQRARSASQHDTDRNPRDQDHDTRWQAGAGPANGPRHREPRGRHREPRDLDAPGAERARHRTASCHSVDPPAARVRSVYCDRPRHGRAGAGPAHVSL